MSPLHGYRRYPCPHSLGLRGERIQSGRISRHGGLLIQLFTSYRKVVKPSTWHKARCGTLLSVRLSRPGPTGPGHRAEGEAAGQGAGAEARAGPALSSGQVKPIAAGHGRLPFHRCFGRLCGLRVTWAVISRDVGHAFHGISGNHFTEADGLVDKVHWAGPDLLDQVVLRGSSSCACCLRSG